MEPEMFLPSTIFGHVAKHFNYVVSSPNENNNIKKVYRFIKYASWVYVHVPPPTKHDAF